jgi:hypothetical protein
MLLLVAKIASFHQQQEVFDTLMYLLCGFTGLLGDPPVRFPLNHTDRRLERCDTTCELVCERDE